ncbi:hypothetical protein HJFPF1_03274 [Paramyrothecium foliicola]|nr:hypothetical protein HJFPF1_03274 [Paramyrothecium foliicola]
MRLHYALWAPACLLAGSAVAAPNYQPPTLTRVPSFGKRNGMYSNSTTATVSIITKDLPPIIVTPTSSTKPCISLGLDEPSRFYYILRTETITWTAAPELYTPPYPEIEVPEYCPDPKESVPPPWLTSEESISAPQKTGDINTSTLYLTEAPSRATGRPPARQTITIVTVDKNPAVVFSSVTAPDYIQSNIKGRPGAAPTGSGGRATDGSSNLKPGPSLIGSDFPRPGTGDSADERGHDKQPQPDVEKPPSNAPLPAEPAPRPTFTVSAGGNQVIINNSTFGSLRPSATSVVTVDQGTFTIKPTAIVGEGATITKPIPHHPGLVVPSPTSSVLGGLPVAVSGSQVVVGEATVNIPQAGTITTIDGKAVSIGRDAVVVDGQSVTYSAAGSDPSLVAGGKTVEAIGQSIVVVHSTTITYGPGIAETSQVLEGETIMIGSNGVVIHGTTMGGLAANPTSTATGIVGGLTVTAIGPSAVAVDGNTITLGPDSSRVTVVVQGKTVTIGSSEVILSLETYTFPGASIVVTTINPAQASTTIQSIETGLGTTADGDEQGEDGGAGDDESGAVSVRASSVRGLTVVCIAIGVLFLV